MIDYKIVKTEEINRNFLSGFVRNQLTKDVMVLSNGVLKKKKEQFLESWDEDKLAEISLHLKEVVNNSGVLVAAYDEHQVVGFANIESQIFNGGYMNLDYIHVSRDYRHLGIGKKLFERMCLEAKALGAKKLYISGHPNIYTQMFYKRMGCVLAQQLNEALYKAEPYDIHLEKEL